jgi:hypothetical protein
LVVCDSTILLFGFGGHNAAFLLIMVRAGLLRITSLQGRTRISRSTAYYAMVGPRRSSAARPRAPHRSEVFGKDAHHLRPQILIAPRTNRELRWAAPLCDTLGVGGCRNPQNPADRLDPINIPMFADEGGYRLNGRSSSA